MIMLGYFLIRLFTVIDSVSANNRRTLIESRIACGPTQS